MVTKFKFSFIEFSGSNLRNRQIDFAFHKGINQTKSQCCTVNMSCLSKSHILLLFFPLLYSFMSPLLQDTAFFSFHMNINDDVSKPIKLIEKNFEIFQMDPIYEINSQFVHYVLLDTHTLQMLTKLWSN